jgi:TrmH family RNA methyltransferase
MIRSVQNPKIQWVRKLQSQSRQRREVGAFVIEGVRLVEEALLAGWDAQMVLYTEDLSQRGMELVEQFKQKAVLVEQVSLPVMRAASDTQSPQGILALITQREQQPPDEPDFLLILDGVRDPGNLGTMLRTAAAAGVQVIFLLPGTVDPYAPKVLRAAMGAHFRLAIQVVDWQAINNFFNSQGVGKEVEVYLADASGELPYIQANLRQPCALIIGGEAEGAGQQARLLAKHRLSIPMAGSIESLNAAMAAAILLFEVVRQRQSS